MKMAKKQFRIGELADRLQVKRFVIRFWEKEFELSASRSTGKQRFYSEEDYATFSTIKQLLYHEKFTISGAKKQLSAEKRCIPSTSSIRSTTVRSTSARSTTMHSSETRNAIQNTQTLPAEKTTLEGHVDLRMNAQITTLTDQMIQLREKLIKLNELL